MQDVWDVKNRSERITIDGNGSRSVKAVVYVRVSTSHDEQINALDNQIEWCKGFLSNHPQIELVDDHYFCASDKSGFSNSLEEKGFYIDAGRSGLSIKRRMAFQKMIADAKDGKFDLIIVRDNSRFSRNLQDFINTVRGLKERKYGVGVYFAAYELFSLNSENEPMINFIANFSEIESKNTSERVLRNLEAVQRKRILFGNGNILGYNLEHSEEGSNHYTINEEQAIVVKEIFDLCYKGFGIEKIRKELTRKNYKNSSGVVKWSYHNIQRVLHNKTYCGYIAYNKCITVDYKSAQRKNNKPSEAIYYKADKGVVPEIISEELFDACQKQLSKRKEKLEPKTAKKKTAAKNIYSKKLRCKCGNSFRCDFWHKNKAGVITHGFTCYNVLNNGREQFYKDNNVETKNMGLCDMKAISETKLRMQAVKVFENVFDKNSLIQRTIDELQKKQRLTHKDYNTVIGEKKTAQADAERRQDRYIDLLADGKISDEQFNRKMKNSEEEIRKIKADISNLEKEKESVKVPVLDKDRISVELGNILDFKTDVNEDVIDKYVYSITVNSETDFIWRLHFKPITTDNPTFVKVLERTVTLDDAIEYARSHGTHVKKTLWKDIKVTVEFAV
jgi:DNA invertase Pin-like site-specific DNA recombinase